MRFLSLLILSLLFFSNIATAERRVALVIGNAKYEHATPLKNPGNDANDVAVKLRSLGFEVTLGLDQSTDKMRNTVRSFVKNLSGADIALFFYAGHGLQVNGTNYIVPVDAKLENQDDLSFEALPLDFFLQPMERSVKTNLVFLDACRDNPLARNLARSMGTRSSAVGAGLAAAGGGVGTLISYSTQPGYVALDGDGRNSPFTTALLAHLGTPGQDILRDLVRVRQEVLLHTDGKQVPWDNSSLTGDVILKPGAGTPVIDDSVNERVFWESIKDANSPKLLEQYLNRYPKGLFAEIAREKIELSRAQKSTALELPKKDAKSDPKNDDFTEPSADHPYDGFWEVTRIAAKNGKESSCGWPSLIDHIEIKNSKFDSPEWKGNVDKVGNLKGFHYFSDAPDEFTKPGQVLKPGRNRLVAKIVTNQGNGKFNMVGGGCRGILKLARQ